MSLWYIAIIVVLHLFIAGKATIRSMKMIGLRDCRPSEDISNDIYFFRVHVIFVDPSAAQARPLFLSRPF